MSERRRTALRFVVEGLVVLVSILAAFVLEGWRDDRELTREVRLELASVGRELARNHEIVAAELEAIRRVVGGIEATLALLEADPSANFVTATDSLAYLAATFHPTFDPSLGAAEALISSGRLAEVSDPELRLGLAGLRDMFTDAAEEQLGALQASVNELHPRMLRTADMAGLRQVGRAFLSIEQEAGRSPQEQTAGGQLPTYGPVAFPNDLEVRGALQLKLMWYDAAVAELRPLLPHLERLVHLVDEEIS